LTDKQTNGQTYRDTDRQTDRLIAILCTTTGVEEITVPYTGPFTPTS